MQEARLLESWLQTFCEGGREARASSLLSSISQEALTLQDTGLWPCRAPARRNAYALRHWGFTNQPLAQMILGAQDKGLETLERHLPVLMESAFLKREDR